MRRITTLVLLAILSLTAHAQTDYYTDLMSRLETDFGVTGGTYVNGGDEDAVLAGLSPVGSTAKTVADVTDLAFSKSLNLKTTDNGNPWDNNVQIRNPEPIANGDAMLLVLWIRGISAAGPSGQIDLLHEEVIDPYDKSLLETLAPPDEWKEFMLPFETIRAYPADGSRFQINMGSVIQELEVGGVALINFGDAYSAEELPSSSGKFVYQGMESDAAWRADAANRIETLRTSEVTVKVVDDKGNPVAGVAVDVELDQHAFGFGTAVAVSRLLDDGGDGIRYKEKLLDLDGRGHGFSIVVMENALKWPTWEDSWPTGKPGTADAVEWFVERRIPVRGHNLIWPGSEVMPGDVAADIAGTIEQRAADHIKELAGYPGIKGNIKEWDVINEPTHVRDVENALAGTGSYVTGREIYAEWFKLAAEADPDAKLFINEYSVIMAQGNDVATQEAYKQIIQEIKDGGGRIDGIGVQGHMSLPYTGIDRVQAIYDDFAALAPELSVTEYDERDAPDELAAQYMRDLLTITFAHPSMTSFLMWGFWDGNHWFDRAPMFDRDWNVKPAGEAFIDQVFNIWWTRESGVTDENGLFTLPSRAYKGRYEVRITRGEETEVVEAMVDGDGQVEVTAGFLVPLEEGPEIPKLGLQVYPNPFFDSAEIRFQTLPSEEASVELFDLLGRKVAIPDGDHGYLKLDGSRMAPGVYWLRVEVGEESVVRRLVRG